MTVFRPEGMEVRVFEFLLFPFFSYKCHATHELTPATFLALHFHLSVANDHNNQPRTPSGLSYEEAEFAYEPFLDENRDRELLDLLPDYLQEEICFPRSHAVKFYGKVGDSMTKRVVVEDEDE